MKKINLKIFQLVLPPVVIVLFLFVGFIIFNNLTIEHIENEADKHIDMQFSLLNLMYSDSDKWEDIDMKEDFLLPFGYIMFDEKSKQIYPDIKYDNPLDKENISILTKHYLKNPNQNYKYPSTAVTNGKIYRIQSRIYYVDDKGYLTFVKTPTPNTSTYTCLAYCDMTSLIFFVKSINDILITVVIISAFLISLTLFLISQKMDHSFNALKKYILKVGSGDDASNTPSTHIKEFQEIFDTIKKISNMIDKAQKSQETFFQNSSHELKTPLMNIQGYTEGIQKGVIKDIPYATSIILKETNKMSTLIDEILLLSKIENAPLKKEKFDLKELIYECAWNFKTMYKSEDIEFLFDFNDLSEEQIQSVAKFRNRIPRKSLGYKSPIEALSEWLGNSMSAILA